MSLSPEPTKEDSKAMPPPSPHSPLHVEASEDFGTFRSSRENSGASVPLYTTTPLPPSRSPSLPATTMATALRDPSTSALRALQPTIVEHPSDSDNLLWKPHNGSLTNPLAQNNSGLNFSMPFAQRTPSTINYESTAFGDNYNLAYQSGIPSGCSRTLNTAYGLNGLPSAGMNVSSYPANMYQMGPQQPYEGMDLSRSPNNNLMQLGFEYDDYPLHSIPEESTAYSTPYDSDVTRSSTPSSPGIFHDEEPVDADQPYAQLIYKALLQAPNNTMILRDIYDWFKKNTGKAADTETKGWQNSIRHNLSMNGAFEKVNLSCEEVRKGFMWRLTEEAKQHGVKSTTRYRSKQPNKRDHRSGLYPQRQRAGALGGKNAKKQLRHRTRLNNAYRSEPHQTRSIPTPATFDAGFSSDMSMYSPLPYYNPSGSEVDTLEYPTDTFGNPVEAYRPDMMHGSYTSGLPMNGLPMLSSPVGARDAYIQLPSDPAEPLFTNSPSPSASEPRTPDSDIPSWNDNVFGSFTGLSDSGFNQYPITFAGSTFAHEALEENE